MPRNGRIASGGNEEHLSRSAGSSRIAVRSHPRSFRNKHAISGGRGAKAMEADGGGGGLREEAGEPRDARVVKELLRSMGLGEGEYEPRVVHQFLELAYRYVVDVLSDAQVYADHASKTAIDPDDVRLAIQSKVNFSFSQPPPREVLLELARRRNKIPLPKTIAPPGSIPLPPEQDTLISPNYQLLIPRKQPPQVEETEEDVNGSNVNPTTSSQEQQTLQRVSFPLSSAAKRPR